MRFNDLRRNHSSISTVGIVDITIFPLVFIQSGFLEHNNDRAQLQMMPKIGSGEQLHLPAGLYVLADKGYPCQYPLLTPWREQDIAGDECRKLFNIELRRV